MRLRPRDAEEQSLRTPPPLGEGDLDNGLILCIPNLQFISVSASSWWCCKKETVLLWVLGRAQLSSCSGPAVHQIDSS